MFQSMYVGATGLKANSVGMQTVGANLANMNTVGYKQGQTFFETLTSEVRTSAGRSPAGNVMNLGQVGLGVGVAGTRVDFGQGSFESGSAATDMAISGKGFFGVQDDQGRMFYTRAGVFRFDSSGVLRDPNGNILQGYSVDDQGNATGSVGGITLPMVSEVVDGQVRQVVKSEPQASSLVSIIANLDNAETDRSVDPDNPFFSLLGAWDGTADPPLGVDDQAFSSSITVYDAEGNGHELTVHFDKATASDASGRSFWEYVVTVPPGDDIRAGFVGTSGAGLVAAGTLAFTPDGELVDQTCYVPGSGGDGPKDLSAWELADISADGLVQFDLPFDGGQAMTLDLGLRGDGGWSGNHGRTAADVGTLSGNLARMTGATRQALSVTAYNNASVTISAVQDGYPPGYLEGISVDKDGVVIGHFSNGVNDPLAKVALYNMANEFGLRREGGNLFTATAQSGTLYTGQAGEDGLGQIYGGALETSNVDMTLEFTRMILSQRGLQANSKVITTTDQITNTLIQAKR